MVNMPFGDADEKYEDQFEGNSSGSDENYQTDEEFSSESLSDSIKRLKNFSIAKNHKSSNFKKTRWCKANTPLRNAKHNRHFRVRTEARKTVKRKTLKNVSVEGKKCLENPTGASKNGKRCRLGGKAKGKLPQEEHHDKSESDDDTDGSYLSRISLGYFQKFRDKSGASTSYAWPEENPKPFTCDTQETVEKTSEEMELLELQRWGMTSVLYSQKSGAADKLEKINPDSL